MATYLLSLFLLLFLPLVFAAAGIPVAVEFLYPNYSASNLLLIDSQGVFLNSPSAFFHAGIINTGSQQSAFYLAVVHVPTSTVVWAANRDAPVTNTGTVSLSTLGLSVAGPNGIVVWSTPALGSPVHALRLLDSGNLLLLDASNSSLWQSFERPTDVLLSGQPLAAGASLTSSTSKTDLSKGDYALTVTANNAVMTWKVLQQYWWLSADARSVKNSAATVAVMLANETGLFLLASGGEVVVAVFLPSASFRILKLSFDGRLLIDSYATANSSSTSAAEFVAPTSNCDLPFICNSLGACSPVGNGSSCSCPAYFSSSPTGGCSPAVGMPPDANSTSCGANSNFDISYVSLAAGILYFGIKFASPATSGGAISDCQRLCTGNCSCLGFFYNNSSMSCYLVEHELGSLSATTEPEAASTTGSIKTLVPVSPPPGSGNQSTRSTNDIPVILPTVAAFLLLLVFSIMMIVWWRKRRRRLSESSSGRRARSVGAKNIYLGRRQSATAVASGGSDGESEDDDEISIPGLPTRFTYAELEEATENFRIKVGSGGFGAVYKGELPDKSLVAVKKIDVVGLHGKKEFLTEIAVIGNIRHVNLVRLRGFCAQGPRRLLVYEYMSRGSLARSLFGPGPVLEWQERVDVAIGAARGLAYLHSGCEHRIIHCDVKPENILLSEHGKTKIGDFGLAKLLRPEQSGVFTTMRGTRGYLAPEWLTNAAISDRTDVYSYGMVLLELVRGRKNRPMAESEGGSSSEWSSDESGYFPLVALEKHEQRRYWELADPRLEGRVEQRELRRMVKVGLCCLHEEPGLRPSMSAVVGMLEGTMEVAEPRVESLGFLRLYGRGFADPTSPGEVAAAARRHNLCCSEETTATTTSGSLSYISSQDVSGPR